MPRMLSTPTMARSFFRHDSRFVPSRYPNQEAKPFFEGLLPEGTLRERIARDLQVSYDNGFGLLAKIGAECAGAVVILPKGSPLPAADQIKVQWLSEDELHQQLVASRNHPLGGASKIGVFV